MSITATLRGLAETWCRRLAIACAILLLARYLIPFALPWQTIAIFSALALVTGLCYLVVGLGGPKRQWTTTLFGLLWTLYGATGLANALLRHL